MPKGELSPVRNADLVSATPSPSVSRNSVMRFALGTSAPTHFMTSFMTQAATPSPRAAEERLSRQAHRHSAARRASAGARDRGRRPSPQILEQHAESRPPASLSRGPHRRSGSAFALVAEAWGRALSRLQPAMSPRHGNRRGQAPRRWQASTSRVRGASLESLAQLCLAPNLAFAGGFRSLATCGIEPAPGARPFLATDLASPKGQGADHSTFLGRRRSRPYFSLSWMKLAFQLPLG